MVYTIEPLANLLPSSSLLSKMTFWLERMDYMCHVVIALLGRRGGGGGEKRPNTTNQCLLLSSGAARTGAVKWEEHCARVLQEKSGKGKRYGVCTYTHISPSAPQAVGVLFIHILSSSSSSYHSSPSSSFQVDSH